MEPGGIEAQTIPEPDCTGGDSESSRASERATITDPDLNSLVQWWPSLSDQVRACIVAVARSGLGPTIETAGMHSAPAHPDVRSIARQGIPCEHGRGSGGSPASRDGPPTPRDDAPSRPSRRPRAEKSTKAADSGRVGTDRPVGGTIGGGQ